MPITSPARCSTSTPGTTRWVCRSAIYTLTLDAIERLRLSRHYRDEPPGDLFLVLHRHRRDAFPRIGCPHLAQTVVSVIGDGGRRRRLRLPGRGARSPA
jgi:hypothetical protein